MITLGIETSCDETAVAILEGRKVLGDEVTSSAKEHTRFGGIVPDIASRSHVEIILPCLDGALKKAQIPLSKIDLIAVTQGPGLFGSLVVGAAMGKSLGLVLGKPVVPVDHVLAHAYSGQMMLERDHFPFMALVVSGGHTLLIYWKSLRDRRLIGRTHDDAAGEAFDKVAKMMELGYPGGPVIDRLSRGVDPRRFQFPRPWIREEHYDFSYSGLKTAVLYTLEKIKKERPLTDTDRKEISSGFQEAVCDTLIEKSLRASERYKVKLLAVGGGVSANSRLREKLVETARVRSTDLKVIFPTIKLAVDNAVMIAALGAAMAQDEGLKKFKTNLAFESYSDFFSASGTAPKNKSALLRKRKRNVVRAN